MAAIVHHLSEPSCHTLTLTDQVGIGKTQLALRAAQALVESRADTASFADGISFVPLASITDTDLALPTIAHVLKLPDQGSQPPMELLGTFLRDKRLFLILDNFEQVVAAAPHLVRLIELAGRLTILLTSREALRV